LLTTAAPLPVVPEASHRRIAVLEDKIAAPAPQRDDRGQADELLAGHAAVTVSCLLRQVLADLLPRARELECDVAPHLGADAAVNGGRRDDLLRIFHRVLEAALVHGAGPLQLKTYIVARDDADGEFIVTDVSGPGLNLPDAMRQTVCSAVCRLGGITSYISDSSGVRLQVAFPLAGSCVVAAPRERRARPN
jgi:hypothetical protein